MKEGNMVQTAIVINSYLNHPSGRSSNANYRKDVRDIISQIEEVKRKLSDLSEAVEIEDEDCARMDEALDALDNALDALGEI